MAGYEKRAVAADVCVKDNNMDKLTSSLTHLLSLSSELSNLLPEEPEAEEEIRAKELCRQVQITCLNIGRVASSGVVSELENIVLVAKVDEYREQMEKLIELSREKYK